MPRRVSLPAADDLFRPTSDPERSVRAVPDEPEERPDAVDAADDAAPGDARRRTASPSGRVRHDEKMTVYLSSAELLALEHARLSLRSEHGLALDRGRLVREAIALVLADLEAAGAESALVRRLAP